MIKLMAPALADDHIAAVVQSAHSRFHHSPLSAVGQVSGHMHKARLNKIYKAEPPSVCTVMHTSHDPLPARSSLTPTLHAALGSHESFPAC